MSRIAIAMVALLFPALSVRAEDPAPKDTIAKALKAQGFKDDGKALCQTWKDQGVVEVSGLKIEYAADFSFRPPDGLRFEMTAEVMGQKIAMKHVTTGDTVWDSMDGKTEEVKGEKKDYSKLQTYYLWVSSLTPLNHDKQFKLSSVVGKKVNDKETLGVLIERKDKPETTLYFDKESGLLVKSEVNVKDEFQGWKEVLQEVYYEDYKASGDFKIFTRMRVVRDGKQFIDSKPSEPKLSEKLDPKLFEKP